MKKNKDHQKKGQDLGSVVRWSFLKTALIPIVSIKLVLLYLYFFSTNYITEKNLDLLRSNALETLAEMSRTEAKFFDNKLSEVRRNSLKLRADHEAMLKRFPSEYIYSNKFSKSQYPKDLRVDLDPSGHSSLYLSSNTVMSHHVTDTIAKTSEMGVGLKSLVDNNDILVTAYFNSWNNLSRIYPPIQDFYNKFPENFDLTQYEFYYLANEKNNPQRRSVWTDVYLDPAGKGWMLSHLTPIYEGNFMHGVTGLDVTLGIFSKYILSTEMQWASSAFVVDQQGNILTISPTAERYLGLTDVTNYNRKDNPANRALSQPREFNLLGKNTSTKRYFEGFLNGQEQSIELDIEGESYLVTKQVIPETGWQLVVMAPLSKVYGPIIAEKQKITQLGFGFLALATVFYSLFFVYLNRSSKGLAKRITSPITEITRMIRSYDYADKAHIVQKPVNITELDTLLSMNFKIQKAKLRYEKISQEMKVKNEQLKTLAITDQLTQIYNRLKLDEVLSQEIARSHRDNLPLTIAIIDVDKFKLVNDNFGHREGDAVLIKIARLMLENSRSTDTLGRWGGEEFLLILPNTSLEQANEHANSIRKLIEQADFGPIKQVTVSMGVASRGCLDSENDLVERADAALYAAKENGRNRVQLALA